MAYKTKKEKQDEFIEAIGGVKKAEEMARIWKNTHPRYCSLYDEYPKNHTKEEVFIAKAVDAGFTKNHIDLFLAL